jgi:DNA-nicking Smr family endonuclease
LNECEETFPEPIRIPIDGTLDLHAFVPEDVLSVVEEYLLACMERGLYEVKIIHGKGKGALRRTVHALLKRHPDVISFEIDPGPSGWGATLVRLKQ